ncbi:hypothetical protein MLD38_021665 [Melastoma candidum]|uniref:Uncharacterized protein n=1 Tax=Melastoma candidum TaxID=119954 RepID=A0ACB9QGX2_9MYRT|nr:hypothetical protein MLD38_021665 [Melastoma candidum]
MDKIEHTKVFANGINIHVATIGEGPEILFVHGFPELWYTWRHQMIYLASLGYRCIAPDLRGYGDTDCPPSPSEYTALHLVGDLIGILDAMKVGKVFVVGHDWGATVAWYFCLFRPDRVKALVNTSVAFQPRNPALRPIEGFRKYLGDDFYMCKFQKPGEAEEDFAKVDTAHIIKHFLTLRDPAPPIIPNGFSSRCGHHIELPPWLTEEDIDYFASKFRKTGFTGGLNYYRSLDRTWELTAAWTGVEIKVPVKFVIGDMDLTYHFPGMKEYIKGGGMKKYVPFLQEVVVMEGVAHFLQEEKADDLSAHIYDFIKKF